MLNIDLIDIWLDEGLANGFDHQFGHVGQWRKFGNCNHNIADILGLEYFRPMFGIGWHRSVIQYGSVDFSREDGGYADAVLPLILAGTGA